MATIEPKNSAHGPARAPLDTSGSSSDTQSTGNGTAAEATVEMPALAMIWGDAPPITANLGPTPSGGGGAASTAVGGSHPEITVDLGSIRESMQGLLESSRTAVEGYMAMVARVSGAVNDSTVFGQNAQLMVDNSFFDFSTGIWSLDPQGPHLEPDTELQQAAKEFAAGMNPAMTKVMRECADAIELVGQFIVLIDRAGSTYANADYNSVFPEMPPTPVVG
ncbi:hypothetical protein [Streptomyces sp. NPDC019224]|uniref:hypothetical protein n=1 Tax=Streptomyces sp. NPDC019224 TaxID=3154484 RepID=UPI0033EBEB23